MQLYNNNCIYVIYKILSGLQDSNLRPHAPQTRALPTALNPEKQHSLHEVIHKVSANLITYYEKNKYLLYLVFEYFVNIFF